LTDYLGALQDLEIAIKLDPQFAIAYYERELIAMMVLKDKKNAQLDFESAVKLGFTVAHDALRQLYPK
jgi:Tfp pilus assembly protein PilF